MKVTRLSPRAPHGLPGSRGTDEKRAAATPLRSAFWSYLQPGPRRLSLGIVVFCLAMIALIWATIMERAASERVHALEVEMRQNTNLVMAFEQYSVRILRNADAVTQFVESAYLRRSEPNLTAVLAERVAANDFLDVIAIFDVHGRLVASSQQRTQAGVSIGDREEFRVHASGEVARLFVGKTALTPFWSEAVVPITRRVVLPDGSFGGVIMVLIQARHFTDFVEDAAVQPGEVFTLVGLDGITRARKKAGREMFGDDLRGSRLLDERAHRPRGTFRAAAHLDGVMRLFTYRTLTDYPLVVVVGSGEDEVLAEYSQRRWLYYVGATVASLCILLFALVVIVAVFRVAGAAGALAESDARFRNLVELSSDWYWEQDAQFRFTFLSQGHQRIIDANNATSIGRTRWELGAHGPTDEQWTEHRSVLEAHQPFRNFEYLWRTTDSELFYVSISGDPLFDAAGRFTGYRGTGTDITQRKLAKKEILRLNAALEERVRERTEQLEVANQELHAFGYSIAHDLRAPLRAIGGFSEMLLESHLPDINAAGKGLFKRILTNVEWMGQLIDGLLALSQLSTAPVTREAVDLTKLSQEIIDEKRRLEPKRDVEVVLAEGLVIEGDRTMVRRMMQNLIGNAWTYTSNRPVARIEIGAVQDASDPPIFFIKDNGAGFDMGYADKLFQPFQRLHSPSEFQGTGVGLAIVSRIIRRHSGRIRAEAQVDKGASFYFTLWSETPA